MFVYLTEIFRKKVRSAGDGRLLGRPFDLLANAERVYQQVVVTRIMPLGNTTGMTEQERAVIAAWVRSGAKPE